jgi:hypothetical protein
METGAVPWVKPWRTPRGHGSVIPHNVATGRAYSGINIPLLWGAADAKGYPSHEWMTFQQARMRDATVRVGEKGTHIVFTKQLLKKKDDEDKRFSMLRTYNVFNVAQIDGLPAPKEPEELPEACSPRTRGSIYQGDQRGVQEWWRQGLLRSLAGLCHAALPRLLYPPRSLLCRCAPRTWTLDRRKATARPGSFRPVWY